ncbi:hypothetical protein Emag_003533 [Eimeria magna]
MSSASWGGARGRETGFQAPYNEAPASAAAAARVSGIGNSNSINGSSAENPWMELRILSLGSGPSLHARGGAAAAAFAAGCTYIATVDGSLIRTEGDSHQIHLIDFPAAKDQLQLRRLFVSPSGSHLLAAAANGVTVYVHRQARSAVLLQRLKGKIVECVSWTAEAASGVFLVGIGSIASAFSSSSTSKNVHAAVSDAVAYEVSPGSVAVAAAASPSCLAVDRNKSKDSQTASFTVYWLTPVGLLIGGLLLPSGSAVSDSTGNLLSFPPAVIPLPSAAVVAAASSNNATAAAAAAAAPADPLNPQQGPVPLAFAATARHFLLLYEHCVVAYSKISRQYSMSLALPQHLYGKALQLLRDSSSSCIKSSSNNSSSDLLLLTTEFAASLLLQHEEANVWRLLLARQDFTGALATCCTAQQREVVLRCRAQQLLEQREWVAAAAALASCCSLRQQQPEQQQLLSQALRVYVSTKLQHLAHGAGLQSFASEVGHNCFIAKDSCPPQPRSRWPPVSPASRALHQLNEADAAALRGGSPAIFSPAEAKSAAAAEGTGKNEATGEAALREVMQRTQQEIRRLLSEFKHVDELHGTVVGLLQSCGRSGLLRDFLLLRGDEENCARLFFSSAQYRDALDAIPSIQNVEARNNLFVSYAPVLLLQRPQHFVAAAKSPELAALDPWRLLPALLLPITLLQHEKQQHQQQSSSRRIQLVKHFADAYGHKNGLSFPFSEASSLSAGGAPSGGSNCSSSCTWASPTGVGTALVLLLAEAPDDSEEELANAITTLASSHAKKLSCDQPAPREHGVLNELV